MTYGGAGNWYDAFYGNDPSTDNIFGREALVPPRTALLQACLARGGRLADFARPRPQTRLDAILQRALSPDAN